MDTVIGNKMFRIATRSGLFITDSDFDDLYREICSAYLDEFNLRTAAWAELTTRKHDEIGAIPLWQILRRSKARQELNLMCIERDAELSILTSAFNSSKQHVNLRKRRAARNELRYAAR